VSDFSSFCSVPFLCIDCDVSCTVFICFELAAVQLSI
jgi:hypothetical protein